MPQPCSRSGFTRRSAFSGRWVLGVLAVLAIVSLSGCGATIPGDPTIAEGFDAEYGERTVVYNPCTDLSDAALSAAGADPASRDVVTDPPEGPAAWRICQWRAMQAPYFISVAASTHPQDDVRSNSTVTGFEPVMIGARSGLTCRDKTAEPRCYVSMPFAEGMLNVIVGWAATHAMDHGSKLEWPPCSFAVRHARALEPFLPK